MRNAWIRNATQQHGRTIALDLLPWTLLATTALAGDALGSAPQPGWLTAAGLAALALALPLARRCPVAGWLIVAALAMLASPRLLTLSHGPPLAVFSYLLGRRAAHSGPALLGFAALAATGTVGAFLRTGDDMRGAEPGLVWVVMLGTLLIGVLFPWILGRYIRQDRALVAAGWARAEQLEREQRMVAAQARTRERARIAEDMHDALGHDLSLLTLRTAALQLAPDLSAEHRESVAGLRAETAEATQRLREIVGVLREPDEEAEAASAARPEEEPAERAEATAPHIPVDETIEDLVRRSAESGLPVRLVPGSGPMEGSPRPTPDAGATGGPDDPAPATEVAGTAPRAASCGSVPLAGSCGSAPFSASCGSAPFAAYRVVREALTNAAKHAPGAQVTVMVDRAVSGSTVRVWNGPAVTRQPSDTSRTGGTGLVALRERVRLAGGALYAGGSRDGGFEVTARFPAYDSRTGPTTNRADTDRVTGAGSDLAAEAGAGTGRGTGVLARLVRTAGGASGSGPAGQRLAGARATAQHGTRVAAALTGVVTVLLAIGTLGWYVHTTAQQVLSPTDYTRLEIGDSEPAVRETLPARQETDPPLDRAPARPAGSHCVCYRSSGELFTSVDIYRLCFRDGKLAGKTVIQGVGDRD